MAISATPRWEAASQQAWSSSLPSIKMAAMALRRPWTASAMAFPRNATSSIAVAGSSTPEACRAEYSPRLSPAVTEGRTPFSCNTSVTPVAKATIQGWVYWV